MSLYKWTPNVSTQVRFFLAGLAVGLWLDIIGAIGGYVYV